MCCQRRVNETAQEDDKGLERTTGRSRHLNDLRGPHGAMACGVGQNWQHSSHARSNGTKLSTDPSSLACRLHRPSALSLEDDSSIGTIDIEQALSPDLKRELCTSPGHKLADMQQASLYRLRTRPRHARLWPSALYEHFPSLRLNTASQFHK